MIAIVPQLTLTRRLDHTLYLAHIIPISATPATAVRLGDVGCGPVHKSLMQIAIRQCISSSIVKELCMK